MNFMLNTNQVLRHTNKEDAETNDIWFCNVTTIHSHLNYDYGEYSSKYTSESPVESTVQSCTYIWLNC
jgi:hypothetical protein